MRITLNGETKELTENTRLSELLDSLSLPSQRIAVELNRQVVRRKEWPHIEIKNDDRIEIVHFVGGG